MQEAYEKVFDRLLQLLHRQLILAQGPQAKLWLMRQRLEVERLPETGV